MKKVGYFALAVFVTGCGFFAVVQEDVFYIVAGWFFIAVGAALMGCLWTDVKTVFSKRLKN